MCQVVVEADLLPARRLAAEAVELAGHVDLALRIPVPAFPAFAFPLALLVGALIVEPPLEACVLLLHVVQPVQELLVGLVLRPFVRDNGQWRSRGGGRRR